MVRSIYSFTIFLILTTQLFAQPKCKIEHYSAEDGLSHDIITCMLKDHEGFMWFGTWDGIDRFDGHNFIPYKSSPGDKSQLKNDRIDQITEDKFGHLWLRAYDGQIYRFDKNTGAFLSLASVLQSKPNLTFDRIIGSSDEMLWLSTVHDGLIGVPITSEYPSIFYIYKKNGSKKFQLPDNKINCFFKSSDGTIWLGTPHGIAALIKENRGTYTVKQLAWGDHLHESYTAIAESGKALYFATANGNLTILDKNKETVRSIKVSETRLNGLALEKKGHLLFITTTDGELVTMDTENLRLERMVYSPKTPLYTIFEDSHYNIWLEPEREGIVRYDWAKKKFKKFVQPNDIKYNYSGNHYKVFEDATGRVWANMKGGGFGYFDPPADSIKYFYNKPNTPDFRFSNMVNILFYDPDGILWLHTDQRGIEKIVFQPNDFNQHLLVNPWNLKSDNEVRGLLTDRKNRLWIGAKNGRLYLLDQGKELKNIFINPPKNGIGMVYSIMQDHKGSVWLGTKNNGLYRADPVNDNESLYQLSHFENDAQNHMSLSNNQVYSLLEDKMGRIWVGTFDGGLNLAVPSKEGLHFLRMEDTRYGYPKNHFRKIRDIATDKDGKLWLGTTEGLLVLDFIAPAHFKVHTFNKQPGDKTSLGNNDIQFIYRDSENRMWLATSGGGLSLALNSQSTGTLKFKVYTTANGLPSDYLLSCVEDQKHHLWIATQNGLSRFNPKTEQFQNYDSSDGVPGSAFSEASCQLMRDGSLVFGTIKGYLIFRPEQIHDYAISGAMVITNLQINNEDIGTNSADSTLKRGLNHGAITLQYDQNNISVDYTVLDYRSANKQFYQYRLLGWDTLWRNNKSQHIATFTNLSPGHYTFEVRCINGDLYKNLPEKKILITVLPPPWRTWWAILIYVLLSVLLLEIVRRTAITLLRLRQRIAIERRIAELKTRFFTNISHELRTPLTLILNPIEEISKHEQLSKRGMDHIDIVRRNAGRMTRFINQLLDLRKVQGGKAKLNFSQVELVAFIREINGYFADLGHEKKIDFKVGSSSPEVYAQFDAEKMETVLYNLIGNAYKFTTSNKKINVQITEQVANDMICIEVTDEGPGVPSEQLEDIFELYFEGEQDGHDKNLKGTGIGLALAKEFIDLHEGKIVALNNPDGGLTVSFTIPRSQHLQVGGKSDNLNAPENLAENIVSIARKTLPELNAPNHDSHLPVLLLVEDNQDMRRFLKDQLEPVYHIITAKNGEDGLKKARQHHPDVIVSDIMMPKMDGIQMLDQLKNDPLTSHIPIILLSARSAIESQIKGLQYGADYYITKPFENEFLFAAIAGLLNQRKRIFDSLIAGNTIVELSPSQITITSKDEEFLRNVLRIVEEEMGEPDFNIDTVAEMVNMGRTSFYNKFKSLTQLTPVEFVRHIRLERAKQYFDAGTRNVAETAYTVGFNDAKYFGTCFKAKFGCSPSEYLKRTTTPAQPLD